MSLSRKHLAGLIYRRRIKLLDQLNENVDYLATVPRLFTSSKNISGKENLYQYVNDVTLRDVPVDYLEFGVFEGWSMKQWLRINRHPSSRFVGFDTFTGLPEDWTEERPKGAFDVKGKVPDVSDGRVQFVAGLFQRTLVASLKTFPIDKQLVVHIDCDLYSSTLFCLATLDSIIRPGTIVIFDEFFDVLHEFAAFRDYSTAFMREWRGIAYTNNYDQVALQLIQ